MLVHRFFWFVLFLWFLFVLFFGWLVLRVCFFVVVVFGCFLFDFFLFVFCFHKIELNKKFGNFLLFAVISCRDKAMSSITLTPVLFYIPTQLHRTKVCSRSVEQMKERQFKESL